MRTNNEIVSIIENRTKEKGLSMSELARRVGMAKSAISRYFNRTREFPLNRVNDFAKVLDLTPEYILGFDKNENGVNHLYNQLNKHNKTQFIEYGEKLLDDQNNQNNVIHLDDYIEETQNEGVQLALHGRLSAGTGTINYDRSNPEMIVYYGKVPKHDLCFIVKGDSMTPLFKDSEIIFIERTYDIRSGQVIAVSINGEEYVKKAYKEDHQLRLVSLNKKYEDITANEFDDIRVIGRVIL